MFEHKLAACLELALVQNSFDNLIIVVSHDFLGELRKTLSSNVMKAVTHQLSKDLVSQNLTDRELVTTIKKDLDLLHF